MRKNLLPNQISPEVQTIDFTTDVGTSIHRFIEEENTVVFKDEISARDQARRQHSYYYCVYVNGKTIGLFAVPK